MVDADDQHRLDPSGYALGRLRAALTAHSGDDGVWFDSRAWIVTARRRHPRRSSRCGG